jgi:CRP-like cAMP-binding protein
MTVAERKAGHCATCPLRPSSFCGALLDAPAQQREAFPDRLRQTFAGAGPHQTVYFRGEPSEDVYILCYGWAIGFVQLSDGRKQTLSVLLGGDLFSSRLVFEPALHFSVQALTEVRFSRINRADLKARLAASSRTFEALAKACLDESKAVENLLIDLGRRTADERIAHLILSVTERLRGRNVIREQFYPFPLRQQDIADIVGLTPQHVSRVITKFRQAGLIEISGGRLTIMNLPELERIGPPN